MKKMLLSVAILCLTYIAAIAQPYNTLSIQNNTSCTAYVVLFGTTSSSGCQIDYNSSVYAIPPGLTSFANPTNVKGGMKKIGLPSLGAADGFTMVRVYHGLPTLDCTSAGIVNMSSCVSGATTNVTAFPLETACSNCTVASITWQTISSTQALVTIN